MNVFCCYVLHSLFVVGVLDRAFSLESISFSDCFNPFSSWGLIFLVVQILDGVSRRLEGKVIIPSGTSILE
jgi:hypothetical protein